jgi:hypothetical protein
VIAPAIANANFNAGGARVRSLPITADAVKAAMKAWCELRSGVSLSLLGARHSSAAQASSREQRHWSGAFPAMSPPHGNVP